MQTQVDIPAKLNQELKIYKATKGYGSIQEAIIDILDSKFKKEVKR